MALEKVMEKHEVVDSEVTLTDLEETIEYLRNACGSEKGADEMLAKIANCMRTAHEQLANAHSPGTRDKIMHQYNKCVENAIDEHIPNSALKERVAIIGGVTTVFTLLGSVIPGPGTAAGAVVGAIVGAVAGSIVGTTISHKVPIERGHGSKVRQLLHEGKLDIVIGSTRTGGGLGRISKYVKSKKG